MADTASEPTRPASLWWTGPAVLVVVLLLLTLFFGKPPLPPMPGTTYDVTPNGVRGAYLVLEETGVPVRASRRPAEGRVRWLLFPGAVGKNLELLEEWVRAGGRLVLADDRDDHARAFDLPVRLERGEDATHLVTTNDDGRLRLDPEGLAFQTTPPVARVWPANANPPLASIHSYGRGEVWVVHYPKFLQNASLRRANHSVLLVRLAEASSGPTRERLHFDDAAHGLIDRPGVMELLLQPPALWTTLACIALLPLVLWRYLPRFGPLVPPPAGRRRSKDEFVDAMAHLLERKRAYQHAYAVSRNALLRDLAHSLQLPPDTPPEILAETACRRVSGLDPRRLTAALALQDLPRIDAVTFLRHLTELSRLRREFFHA